MDSMEAPASARRRQVGLERREKTRTSLLVAAARVIAELGEHKATIDDFIRAAGVARATFYNYYSTKSDLLDDLWGTIGRDPFRAIQRECAHLRDPAERIGIQSRLILSYARSHSAWGWIVYALSIDAETVNGDLTSFPRPDLLIGQAVGRFVFTNLDSASDMIVGSLRRALNAILLETRDKTYSDELCYMVLLGLGVSERDARAIVEKTLPATPVIIPEHATDLVNPAVKIR